jgi:hypothetical protein
MSDAHTLDCIAAVKADMEALIAGTADATRTWQEHRLRMAAVLLIEWEHHKHEPVVRAPNETPAT